MAAPDLRIVRRPRRRPRASLVAASAPVDEPSKTFNNQVAMSGRIGWQTQVWDLADQVGELRYYVSWRANSCSRCRLIASELDEVGKPTGKTDNARVNEIAASIAENHHGQSQLIKRAVECLTLPGETWLGILYPPGYPPPERWPGRWLAFSRDEIRKTGEKTMVSMPDGADYELDDATDSIFRIWNPHPRYAKEADSPVRACIPALEEIVRTTDTIAAAGQSRLIGAGILFIPQEVNLPATNSPVSADKPGDFVPTLSGASAAVEMQDLLFKQAMVSLQGKDSAARNIPIIGTLPGELIGKIQHMRFDTEITDVAIKTRNDAIARLAMGLDVSPERLLGLGSSTSHWSAWQIGDNDVQLHIAPVMENICEAITTQVFHKMLEREGIDKTKYLIWYDTSQLTADPDKSDDAQKAYEIGAITGDAYRDMSNLGDTGYNLESVKGRRQWAQDVITKDPAMARYVLPLLNPAMQVIEASPPAVEEDRPSQDDGEQEPATEGTDPGYDQGRRGRREDVAAVGGAVELLVRRALELAGKRRRSRADYSRLREIPMHQTHRAMGPVDDASIPKLIEGWDSILDDDLVRSIGADPDAVRAEVRRQVRAALTAEMIDA